MKYCRFGKAFVTDDFLNRLFSLSVQPQFSVAVAIFQQEDLNMITTIPQQG